MAPQMAATLWRGVIFSRLPRPHPRVLGTSVCASTRCFLAAGLSSGFPCVAIVATTTYVFFVQEQLIIMSFFFDPILLIALTTNMLLSVLVRGAIYRWCRAWVITHMEVLLAGSTKRKRITLTCSKDPGALFYGFRSEELAKNIMKSRPCKNTLRRALFM